jgi:CDP-4-dehydro-6-deoxyglucose reductase, E1
MPQTSEQLREEILRLVRQYADMVHQKSWPANEQGPVAFLPGETHVPYAARVFRGDEVVAAVRTSLDFWLTHGPEGKRFEDAFAEGLGVRSSVFVNSGSSANLLAMSCLTSPRLDGSRRLGVGDEVITAAAGFPTTVAPILQVGANVVFIDSDPITGNARCDQLELAYRPGRTRAVMMAHALGNPFELQRVISFCEAHDLWLIEDNCDALGSYYSLPEELVPSTYPIAERHRVPLGRIRKPTGCWGDLSTQSFYPAHHITTGEGGMVNAVREVILKRIVESFRDWGRDCWCAAGCDNTCGKRFAWNVGELPDGFDHKYIYDHLGYNLKPLEISGAIGQEQLKSLPDFVEARNRNWQYLRGALDDLCEFFEFALPTHATSWNKDGTFEWDGSGCRSDCSWFGFMLSVREEAPFDRTDLARFLNDRNIGNRMLFGGNLVRQPAFLEVRKAAPERVRCIGDLSGADAIMRREVFIGVYPGLTRPMLDFMVESLHDFAARYSK